MTKPIAPQPGILAITPYVGGESKIAGRADAIKLSSNENPFGPGDAAKNAYGGAVHLLHRYPSTDHGPLRAAIAEVNGLVAERIICGCGSDEIINLLCQAYIGPGDEVIHTEHGFAMYRISTLAAGGTPVEVSERGRVTDVEAILAGVTDATRMVFIANPNNPTGTMIDHDQVTRLADGLPETCVLVLDGAYSEYVEGHDGGASLVDGRRNVVMTRTFSKIYGLGGLRVGWGYGPDHVIDTLNRIRGPFNLSETQLATAEAAMRDREYVNRCRDENTRLRKWLADALDEHGVPSDPSHANFILARFKDKDEALACDSHLRAGGVIVRRVAGYNLPQCLRITIGDEVGCRRVAQAVGDFKEDR